MFVFWLSLGVVVYTYAGYPILLFVLSLFYPRGESDFVDKGDVTPTVTFIVAAYNEEKSIEAKINNILEIDYPKEMIDIIVVSDGSTDMTDDIVLSFDDSRVSLLRVEGRKGKTEAQNIAVTQAMGEIVVFTDATTRLNSDSLKYMILSFSDKRVGCVGARLVYVNDKANNTGDGNIAYWGYETIIKKLESKLSSLIGVSGCYYAVRKELYDYIEPNLISDFVVAQNIYEKGFRSVYQEKSICTELALDDYKEEFKMRVRVAIRSYGALIKKYYLLNPFKYGLYSLQLFSHKVLRYLVPFFLIAIFITSLSNIDHNFYHIVFVLQVMFYGFAIMGYFSENFSLRVRVFKVPFYFMLVNVSALVSMFKYLVGSRKIIWTPNR